MKRTMAINVKERAGTKIARRRQRATIRQYVRCVQMRAEIILHGSKPISSLVAYSNYAFSLLPRLFGHAFTIPPALATMKFHCDILITIHTM